jgi:hypothetical protein
MANKEKRRKEKKKEPKLTPAEKKRKKKEKKKGNRLRITKFTENGGYKVDNGFVVDWQG